LRRFHAAIDIADIAASQLRFSLRRLDASPLFAFHFRFEMPFSPAFAFASFFDISSMLSFSFAITLSFLLCRHFHDFLNYIDISLSFSYAAIDFHIFTTAITTLYAFLSRSFIVFRHVHTFIFTPLRHFLSFL